MKKKKSKKPLLALLLLLVIGAVGVTFAYFTEVIEIPNIFKTKAYSTKSVEEFVSPDNWTPGTTTDKTVKAYNIGDVDVAVRVSYTEEWKANDGTILPLKQEGESVAIINFDNTNEWIKNGDYYYYNKKLGNGASSSSFIKSVTFNPNIVSKSSCATNTEGLEVSCISTGSGYDNATYTLKIKVETVQYDAYKKAWSTNVNIAE